MPEYDPFQPKKGPRVALMPNYLFGGLGITFALDMHEFLVGRVGERGNLEFEPHDRLTIIEHPTILVPDDFAMELYKALAYHFKLTSLTNDRDDLIVERKRSDKLTDAMIEANRSLIGLVPQMRIIAEGHASESAPRRPDSFAG